MLANRVRLLHPTTIKIKQRETKKVDDLFRETEEVYEKEITIRGQISATVTSRRFAEKNMQPFGDIGEGDLIFIIEADTLKKYNIKIDDMVVEVSGLKLTYFIRAIIPIAHYSGVPHLYKIIASPMQIK